MTDTGDGRLRTILVGSDLSSVSDRVIRTAVRMASMAGADLHVVSAYGTGSAGGPSRVDAVPEAVLREVQEALPAQLRRILPSAARPASAEVRFGRASEVLLGRAREVAADLIVVGAHRGAEVDAHFLGTTADEVLRSSWVPCLAVRGAVEFPLRRLAAAVPLDETMHSPLRYAVHYGSWFGGSPDAKEAVEVIAVHVATTTERPSLDKLADELERLVGRVEASHPVALTSELISDIEPAMGVVNWAWRRDCQLLVVGTRTAGRGQGARLGSISSAIARRSPCPVLLIPPPS